MKKDNKSDYTINFARKALTFLGKHTSLAEPEAVKLLIATLKVSNSYKKTCAYATTDTQEPTVSNGQCQDTRQKPET